MQLRSAFIIALVIFSQLRLNAQSIFISYDALGNRLTKSVTGTYPKPNLTGDSVICQGDTAHLYASGGATYLWSNGSSGASIALPADTTKTYSVTAYSSIGCTTTVQRLLTVKPVPVTGPITGDTVVYAGTSTYYSIPHHTGASPDWRHTNINPGYIHSGFTTDTLKMVWSNPGVDTIEVYEKVAGGCQSRKVRIRVTVLANPAGVATSSAGKVIALYPNPARDGATLSIRLSQQADVRIHVSDNTGRSMGTIAVSDKDSHLIPLPSSFFPVPGIYYVRITIADWQTTQKLTVIH